MVKLLVVLVLIVGALAWMIRRAKRCSSCGCGVVELEGKSSSHPLPGIGAADLDRKAIRPAAYRQGVGSPRA